MRTFGCQLSDYWLGYCEFIKKQKGLTQTWQCSDTDQRGRCCQQQVWRIQPGPGPGPGSGFGFEQGSRSTCSVSSSSSTSPEETTAANRNKSAKTSRQYQPDTVVTETVSRHTHAFHMLRQNIIWCADCGQSRMWHIQWGHSHRNVCLDLFLVLFLFVVCICVFNFV